MVRLVALVVGTLLGLGTLAPVAAGSDTDWLDRSVADWNRPGMPIPALGPGEDLPRPECQWWYRPAESPEDQAVEQAGWKLWGSAISGWGIRIVEGMAESFDGMCRPLAYQAFVFVDGQFAGTLAPQPAASRYDGAFGLIDLYPVNGGLEISAVYNRYAEQDAPGFPSARSTAVFTIDRSAGSPVLALRYVNTEPTGEQQPAPVASPVSLAAPRPAR